MTLQRTLVIICLSLAWLAPAYAESQKDPQEMTFEWAPEFEVGHTFPDFTMLDQDGNTYTSSDVSGANGYLIQFNRSVVW